MSYDKKIEQIKKIYNNMSLHGMQNMPDILSHYSIFKEILGDNINDSAYLMNLLIHLNFEEIDSDSIITDIGDRGGKSYFLLEGKIAKICLIKKYVYTTVDELKDYICFLLNNGLLYLAKKVYELNNQHVKSSFEDLVVDFINKKCSDDGQFTFEESLNEYISNNKDVFNTLESKCTEENLQDQNSKNFINNNKNINKNQTNSSKKNNIILFNDNTNNLNRNQIKILNNKESNFSESSFIKKNSLSSTNILNYDINNPNNLKNFLLSSKINKSRRNNIKILEENKTSYLKNIRGSESNHNSDKDTYTNKDIIKNSIKQKKDSSLLNKIAVNNNNFCIEYMNKSNFINCNNSKSINISNNLIKKQKDKPKNLKDKKSILSTDNYNKKYNSFICHKINNINIAHLNNRPNSTIDLNSCSLRETYDINSLMNIDVKLKNNLIMPNRKSNLNIINKDTNTLDTITPKFSNKYKSYNVFKNFSSKNLLNNVLPYNNLIIEDIKKNNNININEDINDNINKKASLKLAISNLIKIDNNKKKNETSSESNSVNSNIKRVKPKLYNNQNHINHQNKKSKKLSINLINKDINQCYAKNKRSFSFNVLTRKVNLDNFNNNLSKTFKILNDIKDINLKTARINKEMTECKFDLSINKNKTAKIVLNNNKTNKEDIYLKFEKWLSNFNNNLINKTQEQEVLNIKKEAAKNNSAIFETNKNSDISEKMNQIKEKNFYKAKSSKENKFINYLMSEDCLDINYCCKTKDFIKNDVFFEKLESKTTKNNLNNYNNNNNNVIKNKISNKTINIKQNQSLNLNVKNHSSKKLKNKSLKSKEIKKINNNKLNKEYNISNSTYYKNALLITKNKNSIINNKLFIDMFYKLVLKRPKVLTNVNYIDYINNIKFNFKYQNSKEEDLNFDHIFKVEMFDYVLIQDNIIKNYYFGDEYIDYPDYVYNVSYITISKSYFLSISKKFYNKLLKIPRIKYKEQIINYFENHFVFSNFSFVGFITKFFNYFQKRIINKRSYIIEKGKFYNEVYFLVSGTYNISITCSLMDMCLFIENLSERKLCPLNDLGSVIEKPFFKSIKKKYQFVYISGNEVFNITKFHSSETSIFDAECVTSNGVYYAIDKSLFINLLNNSNLIINNLKKYFKLKKTLAIERFYEIINAELYKYYENQNLDIKIFKNRKLILEKLNKLNYLDENTIETSNKQISIDKNISYNYKNDFVFKKSYINNKDTNKICNKAKKVLLDNKDKIYKDNYEINYKEKEISKAKYILDIKHKKNKSDIDAINNNYYETVSNNSFNNKNTIYDSNLKLKTHNKNKSLNIISCVQILPKINNKRTYNFEDKNAVLDNSIKLNIDNINDKLIVNKQSSPDKNSAVYERDYLKLKNYVSSGKRIDSEEDLTCFYYNNRDLKYNKKFVTKNPSFSIDSENLILINNEWDIEQFKIKNKLNLIKNLGHDLNNNNNNNNKLKNNYNENDANTFKLNKIKQIKDELIKEYIKKYNSQTDGNYNVDLYKNSIDLLIKNTNILNDNICLHENQNIDTNAIIIENEKLLNKLCNDTYLNKIINSYKVYLKKDDKYLKYIQSIPNSINNKKEGILKKEKANFHSELKSKFINNSNYQSSCISDNKLPILSINNKDSTTYVKNNSNKFNAKYKSNLKSNIISNKTNIINKTDKKLLINQSTVNKYLNNSNNKKLILGSTTLYKDNLEETINFKDNNNEIKSNNKIRSISNNFDSLNKNISASKNIVSDFKRIKSLDFNDDINFNNNNKKNFIEPLSYNNLLLKQQTSIKNKTIIENENENEKNLYFKMFYNLSVKPITELSDDEIKLLKVLKKHFKIKLNSKSIYKYKYNSKSKNERCIKNS